jgi:hypothetical protein
MRVNEPPLRCAQRHPVDAYFSKDSRRLADLGLEFLIPAKANKDPTRQLAQLLRVVSCLDSHFYLMKRLPGDGWLITVS